MALISSVSSRNQIDNSEKHGKFAKRTASISPCLASDLPEKKLVLAAQCPKAANYGEPIMSYARINTMTFVSPEAADTLEAQYVETAPESFTEATLLTFVRTGPTTASLTSVYPDKEAFDRSAPIRAERMKANEGLVASVEMTEGDVRLCHTK